MKLSCLFEWYVGECVGSFFTPFSPTRREYIITPSWRLDAHGLWTDRTKQTEMIYSFCDFLRLTMFACEVERERKRDSERMKRTRERERNANVNKTCMNCSDFY